MRRHSGPVLTLLLSSLLFAGGARAQVSWKQLGPYGGDVRSFAGVPNTSRVFLSTSNAQIYVSNDRGRSWRWWSEVAPRPDYVVDDLIVDEANPSIMYAGAWSTGGQGGGVFKSTDGGKSWTDLPGMRGQPVRALVQWRRDPRILVAGALTGVYRSSDAGTTWARISPANHEEIRNIESVAVDSNDASIIYAGTWHLPWKTTDGGHEWTSIKNGMIDDSDVFSIQVDWSNPARVYASACSGIYRSENTGDLWRKIQGIPHSARRTRVIRQDPKDPAIVYAGTTEGLWKTESGGDSWRRITPASLIVNDILIDAANPLRIMLGTDRAGVLQSADAGATFQSTNDGFAHRQVSSTAFDPASGRLYAAVLNDKDYGGVFATEDGKAWTQLNKGLDGRDVTALIFARDNEAGRLLAATKEGIWAFDPKGESWERTGRIAGLAPRSEAPGKTPAPRRGSRPVSRAPQSDPRAAATGEFKGTALGFFQAAAGEPVYAATERGILRSLDLGATWQHLSPYLATTTVAADGKILVAGNNGSLEVSVTAGEVWFHIYLPYSGMSHVNAVAVSGKTILAATDTGLFRSSDLGGNWEKKGNGVPFGGAASVRFEPGSARRLYVTSRVSGDVYVSEDAGQSYRRLDVAGLVGRARTIEFAAQPSAGRLDLVVASAYDGLFLHSLGTGRASATGTE